MSDNEQLYYDTLKRIARGYQTTEQLRRNAKGHYGLPYHEVLEMVYDNLQAEAADAIRGKRRPKSPTPKLPEAVAIQAAHTEVCETRQRGEENLQSNSIKETKSEN